MQTATTPFDTITGYLEDDHHRLDQILVDVRAMIGDGELERAEHSFGDFDSGLRHHIRQEEELLFPEFDRRTGFPGPTRVMLHEHRQIERLLEQIAQGLAGGRKDEAADGIDLLTGLLAEHNMKEERILYPRSDAALSADERLELIRRMQSL